MANTYTTTTSATQTSTSSSLSSFVSGTSSSIASGVSAAASSLKSAGLSVSSAISGGLKEITNKFDSAFSNLPTPPAAKIKLPEEVLRKTGSKAMLTYPQDLGDYFITLSFYEYSRPSATSIATKVATSTIALPLHQTLMENFQMQIETATPGALIDMAQNAFEGQDVVSQIDLKSAARTAAVSSQAQGLVPNKVRAVLGSDIGNQAAAAVQQSGGFAINPHLGLLFKGVNIRAPHVLVYRFAPKNANESQIIKTIIQELKYRMHPNTNEFQFSYPDLCDIKIHRPAGMDDDELYKFKACFLESMVVNYAPNGTPTFFAGTRQPTEIEVSMVFKETEIFTRDDFGVSMSSSSSSQY